MLARIGEAFDGAAMRGLDGDPLDFRVPRNWIALTARPGKENEAADWLRRASMLAYWPCYPEQRRHSRGRLRREQLRAVIPGLIFTASRIGAAADPWPLVRQVPGLTGWLRDARGYPACMTENDIAIIRRIESGLNLPADPRRAHKFKTGDKVRLCDDIYGGWPPAKVTGLADNGRIVVEVALLGRMVNVTLYPHQIEAM